MHSTLTSSTEIKNVGFQVLTAVNIDNIFFWDKKPSSNLTGDIVIFRYTSLPVNAM
jgi:hypothetical protein